MDASEGSNKAIDPDDLLSKLNASISTSTSNPAASHVQAFRFHITCTDPIATADTIPNGSAVPVSDADADVDADVDTKSMSTDGRAGDGAADAAGGRWRVRAVAGEGKGEGAGEDAREVFASDALAYLPVRPGVYLRTPLTVQLTLMPVDRSDVNSFEHSPCAETIPIPNPIPSSVSGAGVGVDAHHLCTASELELA